MPNMDYGLFLDQEMYFLCALRDGDHGRWQSILAQSPIKAAKIYMDLFDAPLDNNTFIYVLRPGENPGVDKALKFQVGKLEGIE